MDEARGQAARHGRSVELAGSAVRSPAALLAVVALLAPSVTHAGAHPAAKAAAGVSQPGFAIPARARQPQSLGSAQPSRRQGEVSAAYVLVGTVAMTNSRGKPSRLAKPDQALLFFEPDVPHAGRRVEPAVHEMRTVGKQYEPRLLVVQRGDRVQFPNLDPILHNVFSVSGKNGFDLEVYGEGESRSHQFLHPGLVRVFCNVHREMFAHIWVVDTEHVTQPEPDGSFRLRHLPPGPGTLTVWHERAEPQQLRLDPATADPLRLSVAMTRPRLPLHKNKFGKPYRRPTEY